MSKFARLGQWVLNGLGADIENIEDLIGEYPQFDNTKEVVRELTEDEIRKSIVDMKRTIEDYCKMAEIVSDSDTDMVEMNISCPNVKAGCLEFGTDENSLYELVSAVRAVYNGVLGTTETVLITEPHAHIYWYIPRENSMLDVDYEFMVKPESEGGAGFTTDYVPTYRFKPDILKRLWLWNKWMKEHN